ncbi:hypothetical protein Bca4012_034000 [Brassica carinata]
MVMELLRGGELFDRIVERGHYSQRKAAHLAKVILGVVQTCHSLGVMHRDLKPENFLFVDDQEDSPLKAIDFRFWRVIVERLSEEKIHSLRETFKTIDSEKSRRVTYKELKSILESFDTNLDNSDISGLMQTPMNEHLKDTVDYEEFIAAIVRLKELQDEEANDRLDSSTKV